MAPGSAYPSSGPSRWAEMELGRGCAVLGLGWAGGVVGLSGPGVALVSCVARFCKVPREVPRTTCFVVC